MISKSEVLKLSSLANISLDEKDVEHYQKQLEKVLDYFETLKSVEKASLEDIVEIPVLEREDLAKQDRTTLDSTIKNAPKALGRAFGVPSVIRNL